MTRELSSFLQKSKKFCPHFHLSLQYANDKNLKSMNRFYTTELYLKQNNYTHALKFYKMALEIREKVFGTSHLDTAQSYDNIGSVYVNQGEYSKALEYYLKALSVYERLLGPNNQETVELKDYIDNLKRVIAEAKL